ncbi:MAG: hypothetical protein PHD15_00625 [Clostridia bacterium]|nr:hypothetical protein [Clostridia bacterium]MDD4386254.1 hypothetical protein [Clostridia bacterium]
MFYIDILDDTLPKGYGYNTSKVVTYLVTGTQWDTTIKCIKIMQVRV